MQEALWGQGLSIGGFLSGRDHQMGFGFKGYRGLALPSPRRGLLKWSGGTDLLNSWRLQITNVMFELRDPIRPWWMC